MANEFRIANILVPVDFSEVSGNALTTAIAVCQRQAATLCLLHIVENNYVISPPGALGAALAPIPELLKIGKENIAELASRIASEYKIVANHMVQTGVPADEICNWATASNTSLIIMGTHGASGIKELLMGSTAYRVVKNASCPVLTVPASRVWTNFKKILFPIRITPNALEKYTVVRPIIKRNGASLHVAGLVGKSEQDRTADIHIILKSARAKMIEDDVKFSSQVYVCDDVADQLIALARTEEPDLIVITASIENLFKELSLAAYTQQIVNHAKVPVLSIRPDSIDIGKPDARSEA